MAPPPPPPPSPNEVQLGDGRLRVAMVESGAVDQVPVGLVFGPDGAEIALDLGRLNESAGFEFTLYLESSGVLRGLVEMLTNGTNDVVRISRGAGSHVTDESAFFETNGRYEPDFAGATLTRMVIGFENPSFFQTIGSTGALITSITFNVTISVHGFP